MRDFLDNPRRYRKFFAALFPLVAVVLSQFVDLPEGWATQMQSLTEALLVALTPVLVWALPNDD